MIKDINIQMENGYHLILLIDSDLISLTEDSLFESLEYHWVVLETPISVDENCWDGEGRIIPHVNFKVYSWASKDQYLARPIIIEHFINNYYGYIKVK